VALTDSARERAEELGIKLVVAGSAPASKAAAPAPAAPVKSGALPARPRGCQHGPLGSAGAPAGSNQVVEQLVDAVSALKMSALKKRGG